MRAAHGAPALAVALAALMACPPSDAAPPPRAGAELEVWVADGMARVGRDERAGPGAAARVRAARGEFEPFQVVVHARGGGLSNVRVVASELAGPGGKAIPSRNLALYLERYVHVARNSASPRRGYRPLAPGWFADGLVPFLAADGSPNFTRIPFAVAAGENQPVWVDLFVPRGRDEAPPGAYVGTVTVTADQGRAVVPIQLTVWDFELPLRPSLKSAFGLNPRRMGVHREQELLLAHKLMPQHLSPSHVRALGLDRITITALPFFSNSGSLLDPTVGSSRTMDPPPAAPAIRRAVDAFPPGLDLYQYVADEPDRYFAIYPTIRAWARAFHAARVRTLVTVPPQPLLLHEEEDGTGRSAVDIWVMLPKQFEPDDPSYRAAVASGNEIWSYNTLVQDDFSPKWQIDYLPVGFRLQPGFISQSLGVSGLLYWTSDKWSNADYWADPYYREGKNRFAGDGTLIYPPRTQSFDTGIGVADSGVPSMRLKWLRKGVEDFEYVQLLKARGRGDFALAVAREVGRNWSGWTRDASAVQDARRRLGEELHRLHVDARRDSRAPVERGAKP